MRKVLASLAVAALVGALGASLRAEAKTVKGEVIDVQCHTKKAENVGATHADCALSCAKKGAVMGIMTPDGVYTIAGDYTADNNKKLLEFISKNVEASGEVTETDGKKIINVASMKAAM
jgi:flagellar hook assembly protein FlgD